MSPGALLERLADERVTLRATARGVRLDPPGAATPELVAMLRQHKAALLALSAGGAVWLVPEVAAAERLVAQGIPRGAVWTMAEARDLLGLGRPEQTRTVAAVMALFDGELIEVRRVPVGPCHVCRGRRWWRSIRGPVRCATCHPPAVPELVAEWVSERPPSDEVLPPWQIGEDMK